MTQENRKPTTIDIAPNAATMRNLCMEQIQQAEKKKQHINQIIDEITKNSFFSAKGNISHADQRMIVEALEAFCDKQDETIRHMQEGIRLASPVYWTTVSKGTWFQILVLEPGKEQIEDENLLAHSMPACKDFVEQTYPGRAKRLPYEKFQKELASRKTHSEAMENLLLEHKLDISCHIYGSFRPLGTGSSIPGAFYLTEAIYSLPKDEARYDTYIAVPAALDDEIVERYELEFISHG
jgi:hypothetical protein